MTEIEDELIEKIFNKTGIALSIYERMKEMKYTRKKYYIYEEEFGIWEMMEKYEIVYKMKDILTNVFNEYMLKIEKEEEWYKICEKKKITITKEKNVKKYMNEIKNLAEDKEFDKLKDMKPELVNFRNGCYDLKNNEFRKRTQEDYITKCLEYNYEESEQEKIEEIREIIKRISNDEEETLEFNLNWLGYCMTGEKTKKKYLVMESTTSSGKSIFAEMFQMSLPIYTYKLLPETFSRKGTKMHRQKEGIKKPIRFVYIEELPDKQINEDVLKDFVTASEDELQCKLYAANEKYKQSIGLKEICITETLRNRFVNKYDYEKEMKIRNRDYNVYLQMNINALMKKNEYKLAYFNLLKTYAHKYYRNEM